MKPNIPNQKSKYLEHGERLDSYTGMIRQVYDTYNFEASKLALMVDYDGSKPFSFDDFPQTKHLIDKLRTNFSGDIQNVIVNGIKSEWSESNKVQDQLVRKVCSAYGIDVNHDDFPKKFARYFSNNGEALKSFIERKKGGLNLSQRVWNLSSDYKSGLEAALSVGIDNGTSAKQLSKKISFYLHDFEKLRGSYTERFGKATNILDCEYRAARLARTEINMSYRTAEQQRWNQLDFVVGYEIKRSGRPFACSVCESLAGKYPKDFKFTGWHPSCRCYSIPILKTKDEFFDDSSTSKNEVKEVPKNFKDWVALNNSRIEEAKQKGTLPYFLKDNSNFINTNVEKSSFDYNGLVSKHGSEQIAMIDQKYKDKIIDIDKSDIEDFLMLKRDAAIYENDSAAIDYFNQRLDEFNSSKKAKALSSKEWVYTDDVLDRFKDRGLVVYKEAITPYSYKQNMGDFNLDEFMSDVDEICSKNEISLSQIHLVNDLGRVKLSIYGSHRGSVLQPFTLEREFSRNNGILTVNHTKFELGTNIQGKGLSKDIFSSLYNQYKNAGIEKINVHANMDVGGYTWGKYGFSVKKSDVDGFITKTIRNDAVEKEMRIIAENYFKLNNSAETFPMNLFCTEKYKKYLLGSDWNGSLDLTDEIQKAVFESYLKK